MNRCQVAWAACALTAAWLGLPGAVLAQNATRGSALDARAQEVQPDSPWLLLPTFSANPKLGASVGFLAGYLHYFDERSQVSTFGINAQYTSTGSMVAGAFGKASFDEDRQRLIAVLAGGNIKNDYSDYLGTGIPLQSNDELRAGAVRYLYRVQDNWFAGVQGVYTNYNLVGEAIFDQQVLDVLGLKGFKSGGLGLSVYHDSRDIENNPTKGWLLNFNNIAYREWLGGDQNFDVYRLDLRGYWEHGAGNVFAVRQNNQWTSDAPPAAFAPVQLRGYTMGQYLGKNMSSIEGEERYRFAAKWTGTVFAGVACLYGAGQDCTGARSVFPSAGLGVQYVLKPKEGIVVNLEYAAGKDGSYGVYLKLGYGF